MYSSPSIISWRLPLLFGSASRSADVQRIVVPMIFSEQTFSVRIDLGGSISSRGSLSRLLAATKGWHYLPSSITFRLLGVVMRLLLSLLLTILMLLSPLVLGSADNHSHCAPEFDLLITDGTVIDGSGRRRFKADIGINGQRITRIGNLKASSAKHTRA